MLIVTDTKEFAFENTAVTIGKFDGLHIGHMKLMKSLLDRQEKLKTVVFTFDKPPKHTLENEKISSILTKQEKYRLYEKMGIDVLIEYPVDKEFMSMTAEDFVKNILVNQLGMKFIVMGDDFKFGKNRTGDDKLLKELSDQYNYEIEVLAKEQYEKHDISSTYVKAMLSCGNIEKANDMLGYNYSIIGTVVKGNQLGRTVGMPTINIVPDEDKYLPPNGVYASCVVINGKRYIGITNVGYKPTVSDKTVMGVEMHILDFAEDVYGEVVCIEFLDFVRPEKKFQTLQQVKEQVDKDIKVCRNILKKC